MKKIIVLFASLFVCLNLMAAGSDSSSGDSSGGESKITSFYDDAVKLVKIASKIMGGKGGGGRKDFAQAGGVDKNKIQEVFNEISKKIN